MVIKKKPAQTKKKVTVKASPADKRDHHHSENGAHHWLKHLEEFKEKFSTNDWLALANQKRDRLVKELYHLGEEMVEKIKAADILANRDQLIHDTKQHLESIVKKVNSSKLLDRAMATAKNTSEDILSFFNIPSSRELVQLQKRLASLEKKISHIKEK